MERTREQQKEILLVPLGKVLVDILEEIAVALRKSYHFHVRIGRSDEPDTATYSDERRQFDAEKLLPLVSGRKRESLVAVLGVVDADMFAGDKSFVFGVNRPERGAAIIALSRMREEFYKKTSKRELFLRRAVTEAIFQVGMAAGLPPCLQKKCVLLPTSSLWRLDEKGQAFCPACQARLTRKLHPETLAAEAAAGAGAPEGEVGDENRNAGPEVEKQVLPASETVPAQDEEAETPSGEAASETAPAAEEAAVHTDKSEPDEPLVADI